MRVLAIDLGFRRNASACAIAYADGLTLHVPYVDEVLPGVGDPLVPSEVLGTFLAAGEAHGCTHVAGDTFGRDWALEYVRDAGMAWVDLSPSDVGPSYLFARLLLRERRVRMARHDELMRQLAETRVRALAGGRLSVEHGSREGRHGDMVSAFVGAAWALRDFLRSRSDTTLSEATERFSASDDWDDDDSEPARYRLF